MRLLPLLPVEAWFFLAASAALAAAQGGSVPAGPAVESVLPALVYGAHCSTEIELRNLANRPVAVEVEGHRASGALVGLAGIGGGTVRLAAHERGRYKLEIDEETTSAWAKIRERPPPGAAPALAVSAASECLAGDQMRKTRRDVAFPQISPWFDSGAVDSVASAAGAVVSLINASAFSALARVCYSSGNLYSAPGRGQLPGELAPICSVAYEVQIPPFGAREFPVEREGSVRFTLRTVGRAIVLEMLRPVDASVRMYRVDSSIRFGSEVSGPRR